LLLYPSPLLACSDGGIDRGETLVDCDPTHNTDTSTTLLDDFAVKNPHLLVQSLGDVRL